MSKPKIAVVIITLNEQANLPHALASVAGWTQAFVVDAGSTDKTREVAEAAGATFVEHTWQGYAQQKNWALDNLPIDADWVLILDADEVVMPDLRAELEAIAEKPIDATPEAAFFINRYFLFLGKRIRHCGYYPSWNIRFFKRGKARYEVREVHERMQVDGPVSYLKGHLEHYDRRGISHWNAKHNQYAKLEAQAIYRAMTQPTENGVQPRLLGNWEQRRRWIKERLYPRLPAKWLLRFFYMYILRLGVLDGMVGLRFCLFVSAYELIIDLNLREMILHANRNEEAEDQ